MCGKNFPNKRYAQTKKEIRNQAHQDRREKGAAKAQKDSREGGEIEEKAEENFKEGEDSEETSREKKRRHGQQAIKILDPKGD